MNKIIFIILFLFILVSCNKKVDPKVYEIKYNEEEIEYENLDKLNANLNKDNLLKKYTFYLEENRVLNAKCEISFSNDEDAKNYYLEIKENENYINIEVDNNNNVTYFHNLEFFNYFNYQKEVLIEMLKNEGYEILN